MYMALHPEVQKKCQYEINENIGTRPPTMDDSKYLPYVNATLMGIQRLSVVAPVDLQHVLTKNTSFNGYSFKKGTIFTSNISKFLMDPEVFSLPESFQPERFIDENGKMRKFEQFSPFGIGKRICMGESLAKNELFLFFVRILQRISFEETLDKPDMKNATYGITRIPVPFDVKVTLN